MRKALSVFSTVLLASNLSCRQHEPTSNRPPENMVSVPAGAFTMGCTEGTGMCMEGGLDRPAHSVWVSAFLIDKTEVTQRAFVMCVSAKVCSALAGRETSSGALPVTSVSWDDARTYCQWVGKRLPTEAEWEKAARGSDERRYPWGNDPPRCDLENYAPCGGALLPVGGRPLGASPFGALEMAGNAEEWVGDWLGGGYYAMTARGDPRGPKSGSERVVRGGSFRDDWWHSGVTVRLWAQPGDRDPSRGFRCAKS